MPYKDPEKMKEWWKKNGKESNRRKYWKDPEKSRALARKYRENNLEKSRDRSREWRNNNRDKFHEIQAKSRNKAKEDLSDRWIKKVIAANSKLRTSDIPASLIDAKRIEMKINRLLKEIENEKHD